MKILIGWDKRAGKPVYFPLSAAPRHTHLVGYTGSGKTTAIITLLAGLLTNPFVRKCVIVIDRLGGFSLDLCRWVASEFCPSWVKERFLFIRPSREDVVLGMNPLLYRTPGEGYYRTARTMELIMRAFAEQELDKFPRLAKWMFNSCLSLAKLGLCLGDAFHLLYPHSDLHRPLLNCLHGSLRAEWETILNAKGGQAEVQLESVRNRLKPFTEEDCVLRPMFSSTANRLEVARWMQEGRFVVIDLAPYGTLPELGADAIGGIIVNEIFSVARSLPPEQRRETLLVLDEFQRFVSGPDLYFGIAECRQLKVELVLSHQSFSQLEQPDFDMTSLIFQAQNRLMLHVAGFDANLLAEEMAALTWDPMAVKDEIWHRCQKVSGHRVMELQSRSAAEQLAKQWSQQYGTQASAHESRAEGKVTGEGESRARNEGRGSGGSESRTTTSGTHEALVPDYEEFWQLAGRTWWAFEEEKGKWGKTLRRQQPGEGVWKAATDREPREIRIKRTAPGHLGLPWEVVRQELPSAVEAFEKLLEANFQRDCFVSPAQIERETKERLERVLRQPLVIRTKADQLPAPEDDSLLT